MGSPMDPSDHPVDNVNHPSGNNKPVASNGNMSMAGFPPASIRTMKDAK